MRDPKFNNTCPECGVRRPNIPLHLRRHHPESVYAVHKQPTMVSVKRLEAALTAFVERIKEKKRVMQTLPKVDDPREFRLQFWAVGEIDIDQALQETLAEMKGEGQNA